MSGFRLVRKDLPLDRFLNIYFNKNGKDGFSEMLEDNGYGEDLPLFLKILIFIRCDLPFLSHFINIAIELPAYLWNVFKMLFVMAIMLVFFFPIFFPLSLITGYYKKDAPKKRAK